MAFGARVRLVSSWSCAALSATAGLSVRAAHCDGTRVTADRATLHNAAQEKPQGVIRMMTFNVKFYTQFSCVLEELQRLQVKYGPFAHTGLVKSQDGWDGCTELDPDNHSLRPVIRGNFDSICKFLLDYRPDIVAIQEGVKGMHISAEGTGYSLQTLVSAECPKDSPSLTLANHLLVNTENPLIKVVDSWRLVTKTGSRIMADLDEPRSAAVLRVNIAGQPVDIVSTHLTGGRFDDQKWRQLRSQRLQEIMVIIQNRVDPTVPMIILGDFNAPSTAAEVDRKYGHLLGATSDDDMEVFIEYMVGVHGKLLQHGWKPAYTKDDLSIPTSVFGGSVDWVYTSPNWPDSIRLLNVDVVDVIHASDAPWASYPAGSSLKLSLSDHNAVMMDFMVC